MFAIASQIWNTDYFLGGITPDPMKPGDKLVGAIEQEFGSLEKFRSRWIMHAEAMMGSGWLWLVKQGDEGKDGRLQIVCTFGTGSPMIQSVLPGTFHYATGKDGHGGLFAGFSFAKQDARSQKILGDSLFSNTINASSGDKAIPVDSGRLDAGAAVRPVLGLSLWEHAYLMDYGHGKEKYAEAYLTHVNWNRVASLLNLY